MIETPAATSTPKSKNKKAEVNYVAHLNAWSARMQRDRRLTSSHISLYMALFFHWNEHWFQNPITVYRDEVMEKAGIGSRNTYAKALRALADWGYIIYGSESRTRGSTIEMVHLAPKKPEAS